MFLSEVTNSENEYRVVDKEKCTIIYGSMPLDHASAIFSTFPPGTIMDLTLARMLGANIAVGNPEDTAAFREKITPDVIARARQTYQRHKLSEEAITWLAVGEQGLSSKALFFQLTQVAPPTLRPDDNKAHPHDVDDLRRCIELEATVPEITGNIENMAGVSEIWAKLADDWGLLLMLYHAGKHKAVNERMKAMGCQKG